MLGVAGGEDGGQPPVGRPLAAEDGVEDAGDLVAQPVELLLHRGHDELAVVAADLDDGAGGVPPVDRHPGVDQPDPDVARRPAVDEVEGVDQGDRGGHRVGVLQLLGRHPPEHGPGEGLHQVAPLAGRAQQGQDRLEGAPSVVEVRSSRRVHRRIDRLRTIGLGHQARFTRSRTVGQPLERGQHLVVVVGQVADEDVGVAQLGPGRGSPRPPPPARRRWGASGGRPR